jgi:hypothetical protein
MVTVQVYPEKLPLREHCPDFGRAPTPQRRYFRWDPALAEVPVPSDLFLSLCIRSRQQPVPYRFFKKKTPILVVIPIIFEGIPIFSLP